MSRHTQAVILAGIIVAGLVAGIGLPGGAATSAAIGGATGLALATVWLSGAMAPRRAQTPAERKGDANDAIWGASARG